MEETQRMGLDDLGQVHDAAQLGRRGRNLDREQRVASFRRSDQMAHRANAAGASGQRRHFAEGAAFAEFFESAELGDVELRVLHFTIVVEMDRDLGMPLDAGDGVDENGFRHGDYAPKWVFPVRSGMRPASEFGKDKENRVGFRRASRDEHVDLHDFVHGPGVRQQPGDDLSRDLLVILRVFDVGAILDVLHLEAVPHARNVGRHGAIPEANEQLGPLADLEDLFQVLLAADRAFDQDHIHVFGILLGIDQRAVDESTCLTISSSRSSMSRNDM